MKERRMVSSVSSSITSALNMGYGIDSSSIVSGLVSAVRDPKDKALSAKESTVGAQISAIANASAALNNFAHALTHLLSTSKSTPETRRLGNKRVIQGNSRCSPDH